MNPDLDPPLGSPPCQGCTRCCERDAVFLHPECGDDPASYETVPAKHPLTGEPGHMLARGQDGASCIYLERGVGCTIWERRPAMCRAFDCRGLFLRMGAFSASQRERMIAAGMLSPEVQARGRELLKAARS